MMTRTSLVALLSVGISAFVLSATHPAFAAVKTFSPATSWAINRIDPPSGGAAYCTLARRFDGNTVITFARNTTGEGTIAVDFQQPLFDPAQTYRIALQAGQGMKREFLTRPATANALVLRTGQDPAFFSALSASNELGVIMDANRYAFTIPDFSDGTGQLAGCISNSPVAPKVTAPNVIARATPAAPAPSAGDNAALAQLRTELDALKQENAGIVASLKQQSNTVTPITPKAALPSNAENDKLVSKLASLESEKNALVEKLQNERSRQQQEAQDEATMKQALAEQKSLKSMLETERKQRADLEAALTDKTAEAEKRGEMRARIEQLESSNAQLKSLRDAVETERQKRLVAEKMLQDQKMAAAASLEDQERLRAHVTDLETQNKSLQETASQVATTKTQLEDTQTRASMEQARREAAENALKEMQLTSSKTQASISGLQQQLESERSKMASAEAAKETELSAKHANEIARLNAEMTTLRAKSAESADFSQKATIEQARREAAEKALEQMQMTVAQREVAATNLQKQLEEERTKMASSEAAKETELSARHATEIDRLNAQLAGLREKNTDAQTEQARREAAEKALEEMRMTVAQREVAAANLQKQLEDERVKMASSDAAKETELSARHAAEIDRLNAQLSGLREKSVDAQTEQARREAAEKAVSELQKQLEVTQQDVIAAHTPNKAVEAQLAELSTLKTQLAQMKNGSAEAATEQARRQATEKELASVKSQLANKETELTKLSAERAGMLAKVDAERAESAKTRISDKDDSQIKEISAKLSDLETRNSDLMAQLQTAKARSAETEKASVTTAANDDQTNVKISEIGRKAEADRRELQTLLETEKARREKLEALMSKGGSDSARLKEMNNQIAELNKRNTDLEKRLQNEAAQTAPAAGNNQEVTALKKQLDALKGDNQMLADKLAGVAKTPVAATEAQIVYAGDDKMAEALAETKTSLMSTQAERDEYRDLLQRERQMQKEGKNKKEEKIDVGANAKIAVLETERADLVRKLEYERSRADQVAAGKEAPPALAGGQTSDEMQKRLASVEAEKDKLKKQLAVTQQDVIAAREKALTGKGATSDDVAALLSENKKLQAELAASAAGGSNADTRAMETEIASLRAQNSVMSQEINKRLAAAPTRAAVDNATAAADFKSKNAVKTAEATVQNRMSAVEAENIRLAKELNASRNKPPVVVAAAPAPTPAPVITQAPANKQEQERLAAVESENIRLSKELAAARNMPAPAPVQAVVAVSANDQNRFAAAEAENIRLAKELAAARATPVMQPIVAQNNADDQMMASAQPLVVQAAPAAPQVAQAQQPVSQSRRMGAPAPAFTPVSLNTNANVGPSGQDIAGYLKRAGIGMVSGFEKINKVSTPQFAAFRWDTGVVFGTAEQQVMPSNAAFEDAVKAYMVKTKQRCSGTFDQSFDPSQISTHKNFATADVACVMPDGTGAGAAMLFFYKDGMFNAIAHEGDITQFDQAMTTRDSLAKLMMGTM